MNPTIYFEDQNGVTVTDRCVIAGDSIYSTESIVSVTTIAVSPKRLGIILSVVISAGCVFFGIVSASYNWCLFGTGLAIVCGFAYLKMKTIWQLRIATAFGETAPLQSPDHEKISTVANAIGQAIVHRT
ncbi:MAG TPA: DUF6232 family protein [Verrucomicrobiae bacterium]|nr:DUF6232 family protein [Verrucomicrobiae bacterium]